MENTNNKKRLPKEVVRTIINKRDHNGENHILMTDNVTGKATWLATNRSSDINTREDMALFLAKQIQKAVKEDIPNNPDTEYLFIVGDSLKGINKYETRKEWATTGCYKNGNPLPEKMIKNIRYIHAQIDKHPSNIRILTLFNVMPGFNTIDGTQYDGMTRYIPLVNKSWKFMDKYVSSRTIQPDDFEEA